MTSDGIELPDGATEEETSRDGFLSYAVEWHALAVGLAAGLAAGATGSFEILGVIVAVTVGIRAAPVKPLRQLKREPWYALGGVVIGFLIGLAASGLVA